MRTDLGLFYFVLFDIDSKRCATGTTAGLTVSSKRASCSFA